MNVLLRHTMTIGSDTLANSIHHQKRLYYLNVLLRHTMTIGSDTFPNSIHTSNDKLDFPN
jgi:hypothetical protein